MNIRLALRGLAALAALAALANCGTGSGGVAEAAPGSANSALSVEVAAEAEAPTLVVSMEDMEALGPFLSWATAKGYGAMGDGMADDTAALQRAIDDLTKPGKPVVLRLNAGTYRITRSLVITATARTYGLSIIGDDPATTRIVWDGPAGGAMLVANGGLQPTFARITWDGRSRAGYGVAHWWNTRGPLHGGSAEHVDEVFVDMEIGIQGGRLGADYGSLDSEGQVRRVKFIRNSKAGLNVGSYNALDWWVWDSHFVDCGRGVSNIFTVGDKPNDAGAGNFAIYRSLFERSTVADVNTANTQWFGVYGNVSIGSRRFFQAEEVGSNAAQPVLQGNRVLDTTDPVAVSLGNLGPLILIDNQFRSAPGAAGPVVKLLGFAEGRDAVSIGNQFTVAAPISTRGAADRVLVIDDRRVDPSAISSESLALPPTPARQPRQVFEVPKGASGRVIQQVIDDAAAAASRGAPNPIVHLPAGDYVLDRTLVVPPLTRIQIAGDSIGTVLNWSRTNDSAPMLRLLGPSKATVRDLRMNGREQQSIVVENADQGGGRISVVGSSIGPLSASGLMRTRVSMQANTQLASIYLNRSRSVVSLGAGNIGLVSLLQGSQFVMSDTWFEGGESRLFRLESGNFTYRGGQIAPADPRRGKGLVEPAIKVNSFSGTATFIAMHLNLPNPANGVHIGEETAASNVMLLGVTSNTRGFFTRIGAGGQVGMVASKLTRPAGDALTYMAANVGETSDAFILKSLTQARSLVWEFSTASAPDNATDVRIYRVMTAGLGLEGRP